LIVAIFTIVDGYDYPAIRFCFNYQVYRQISLDQTLSQE